MVASEDVEKDRSGARLVQIHVDAYMLHRSIELPGFLTAAGSETKPFESNILIYQGSVDADLNMTLPLFERALFNKPISSSASGPFGSNQSIWSMMMIIVKELDANLFKTSFNVSV